MATGTGKSGFWNLLDTIDEESMMPDEIKTHPVQTNHSRPGGKAPQDVTMAAYEVYCHLFGSQKALVTGGCRGGFATSELIALLYARSFPKTEWRQREREAIKGMENI